MKPYVLFIEKCYEGREPYWFGWKHYDTYEDACNAFKDLIKGKHDFTINRGSISFTGVDNERQ